MLNSIEVFKKNVSNGWFVLFEVVKNPKSWGTVGVTKLWGGWFFFFFCKKMLSAPFLTPEETKISLLLSASVERFSVFCIQDFLKGDNNITCKQVQLIFKRKISIFSGLNNFLYLFFWLKNSMKSYLWNLFDSVWKFLWTTLIWQIIIYPRIFVSFSEGSSCPSIN